MTQVNTSQTPYYNDVDDEKLFYEILHIPGRAVQTRELNQVQSYLQKQVSRFGSHIFNNGSIVVPGSVGFNFDYRYITCTLDGSSTIADLQNAINSDVVKFNGDTSGVTGEILEIVDAENGDPITLYVKYTNSGTDNVSSTVTDAEVLNILDSADQSLETGAVIGSGIGSRAYITKGIFYINERFLIVDDQSLLLDKYASDPSYRVGLRVTESIVTHEDDPSLLDNASGTTNENAPGADRLKIEITLEKLTADSILDEDFYQISEVDTGVIKTKARTPDYSELEDALASRTYDESGNYTVDEFSLNLREHTDVNDPGDATKVSLELDPGKAYVRGRLVETISTTVVDADKARDTDSVNNGTISSSYGSSFICDVNTMNRLPLLDEYEKLSFYSDSGATLLGTARIRNVVEFGLTERYFFYFFDAKDTNGLSSLSVITSADTVKDSGDNVICELISSPIFEASKNKMYFKLPNDKISSVDHTDVTFTKSRFYRVTSDGSGEISLTADSNELFDTYSDANYTLTHADGSGVQTIGSAVLGGTTTGQTLTLTGLDASTSYYLNAQVIKQESTVRSKAIQNLTFTDVSLTDSRYTFNKADVFRINSVTNNGNDVTEMFELDNGRQEAYYGLSSAVLSAQYTNSVSGTFTFDIDYFTHGSGDYFAVDSYNGIDFKDIPTETIGGVEVSLGDIIDFRPRIADNGTDFTSTGSSFVHIPRANEIVRADYDYYLNRIDKLALTEDGEFTVIKGEPAVDPESPSDIHNAMTLYELFIPAYTGNATDIKATYIENRGYTMNDIGRLEGRIKNLEYYTSLSLLESETKDKSITDDSGLERFKNGFVIDSFVDNTLAKTLDIDYSASIDPQVGGLKPSFYLESIDLAYNSSTSSNVVTNDDIVTLPYSEVTAIEQRYATDTINVNPYAVFDWSGTLKLNPSVDKWAETRYKDPTNIFETKTNTTFNNTWNSWGINWLGVRPTNFNLSNADGNGLDGFNLSIDTAPNLTRRTTRTETVSLTNKVVDDKIVDISVVPYMRQRDINFSAQGMRPFTRVYPWFDSAKQEAFTKPEGGDFGDPLITDAEGKLSGTYRIPRGEFRTGDRQFRLVDSDSDWEDVEATTWSASTYSARGVKKTRQKTILTTRNVDIAVNSTVSVNRALFRNAIPRVRWSDPIAQSFLVGSADGEFITKIGVWFKTKDSAIPVTMQIREMENGFPTQRIVPGGSKTLYPADVNISDDASSVTEFDFDHPVYLQNGVEYCFVVMANSNQYEMYIAKMGGTVIGTQRTVSKQTYAGVMFKSQNNSTWTADQESDVKFSIHRAEFDDVTGIAKFNNVEMPSIDLPLNAISVTNASSTVTVKVSNHGMLVGSKFLFTDIPTIDIGGIDQDDLAGEQTVTAVLDFDTFQFDVGTNATSTSVGGGGIGFTPNINYHIANLNTSELILPGTDIRWNVTASTGKSPEGSETPYQDFAAVYRFISGNNHHFLNPMMVLNASEEADKKSSTKSFRVTAEMTSTKRNLSPLIDASSLNVALISMKINDPASLLEHDIVSGGNAESRYITEIVGLNLESSSLKAYIDLSKPSGSDVKMFYRAASSESDVKTSDWLELPVITESSPNDTFYQFTENEFGVDDIPDFTHFQVKVVMLSSNMARVPTGRDLRLIALGT